MSAPPPALPPGPETWRDALLTSGSEALLGAVRNYVGPVRTPFDKRDLAAKLEAFLRRSETQESLVALLDGPDVRLVGTALLLGPAPEHLLKELFEGELPLFDLGVRIANLYDRLILFRYQEGGRRLVAVNPLLAERLARAALTADALFGPQKGRRAGGDDRAGGEERRGDERRGGKERRGDERAEGEAGSAGSDRREAPAESACDAESALGFFLYLFHAQGAVRKGGGLTKRAVERAAALLPELAAAPERLDALLDALTACGVLAFDGEERRPDRSAFDALLSRWGEDLPFFLATCLAAARRGAAGRAPARAEEEAAPYEDSATGSRLEAETAVMAAALREPPGGPGFVFSRGGLERWLGIASLRSGPGLDAAGCVQALVDLGVASAEGGGLVLWPRPRRSAADSIPGRLVAEGAHALHLLPEASLEERLFVGSIARPVSFGTVWSFEIERDSVRRAFASGLDAKSIAARLEFMSGSSLPQSLAFSLSAWEEEYRSLRLYRGVVLAADERLRAVIERSGALDGLVAEVLAPGVYFLSSPNPEAAAASLARAGLEASPRIAPAGGAALAGAAAG
ncbi:MAG: helicase-associated domain-containing protein, partial [Treponema sp.]|nr:helicase-associated domain-containing protein [Treponema sp.]